MMKTVTKIVSGLVLAVVAFALSACGEDEPLDGDEEERTKCDEVPNSGVLSAKKEIPIILDSFGDF